VFYDSKKLTSPLIESGYNLMDVPIQQCLYHSMKLFILLDACVANPCRNGATCISEDNTYSCRCPVGFDGPTCMEEGKGKLEGSGLVNLSLWGEEVAVYSTFAQPDIVCSSILVEDI
jgi:hypothetical protein